MPALVYALDVSISMAKTYSNFKPDKLSASIDAIAVSARRAIERGYRIGLVIFAEWAIPLVYPTRSIAQFLSGLRLLGKTFLGSAPGDAVIESVKALRGLHDMKKKVFLVTDGDYNMGIPMEYALAYARQSEIEISIFVIGNISETQLASVYKRTRDTAGWVQVPRYEDLARGLVAKLG